MKDRNGKQRAPAQISNNMFEYNEKRVSELIPQIKDALDAAVEELRFYKEELQLKLDGGCHKVEPDYAYEATSAWKEFTRRATESGYKRNITEKEKKITQLDEGLRCETMRLELIKNKVPAWEHPWDNKKLLEAYENKRKDNSSQ